MLWKVTVACPENLCVTTENRFVGKPSVLGSNNWLLWWGCCCVLAKGSHWWWQQKPGRVWVNNFTQSKDLCKDISLSRWWNSACSYVCDAVLQLSVSSCLLCMYVMHNSAGKILCITILLFSNSLILCKMTTENMSDREPLHPVPVFGEHVERLPSWLCGARRWPPALPPLIWQNLSSGPLM